jgi:hypothetical protein
MFPDTGLYSHMAWKNDNAFTVWGVEPSTHQKSETTIRGNRILNAVARPVFRFLKTKVVGATMEALLPTRAFLEFEDRSANVGLLAPDQIDSDGHPTWTEDERWFLTDTYPLEGDYQSLLLWDEEKDELHELGRFHSKVAHLSYKCDLHPRWDRDERRIAIDSAHRGNRQLVVLDQRVT